MEKTISLASILEVKGDFKFKIKEYAKKMKDLFGLERAEEEAEVSNNITQYSAKVYL